MAAGVPAKTKALARANVAAPVMMRLRAKHPRVPLGSSLAGDILVIIVFVSLILTPDRGLRPIHCQASMYLSRRQPSWRVVDAIYHYSSNRNHHREVETILGYLI
jgi:hypothetical protein